MTREGVRRRLLRGRLDGRKSNETNEWIVILPDEQPAPTVGNDGQKLATVANDRPQLQERLIRLEEQLAAAGRVEVELRAALEGARAHVTDLRTSLERAEDELDRLKGRSFWQRWFAAKK